ncbi:MAG: NYN domain-containing protein [bacterium]
MRSFFRKKCCPEVGCLIDLHQFMSRSEQKLVDVMLSTDALHLAMNRQEETLVVVSSDHDIWPAIHYSALVHPRVAHLQRARPERAHARHALRRAPHALRLTHTGVVVALDDHSFTTIEGNASDDGDESHYEVCQNRRPYDRIDFIQVA